MTHEQIIAEIVNYHKTFPTMEAESLTMHPDTFGDIMKEIGLENWKNFSERPKINGLRVELDTGFPREQVIVDGYFAHTSGAV